MLKGTSNYFIVALGLLFFSFIDGRERTVYSVSDSSKFIVEGTSTLHDWEMISSHATGKGAFTVKNGDIKGIKSLHVELDAETLKSGKKGMDENAYKALKTDDHPTISFDLEKVIATEGKTMKIRGDFSAGGTTKSEVIKILPKYEGGNIVILGRFDITFTEYNMEPPTALMGTIKTGNELTISFKTSFKD